LYYLYLTISFPLTGEKEHIGLTFEELCRAHITRFARGAERYAAETQLSQRVSNWQNRLNPILATEENRKVFDINEYGTNVINVIEQAREKRLSSIIDDCHIIDKTYEDFQEVCNGLPPHEICRLFLASLSLCNSGNIVFVDAENRKDPSSSLLVQLLTNQIDYPTEMYLAPSLK
jgi:condensin-2 complex subunit H2